MSETEMPWRCFTATDSGDKKKYWCIRTAPHGYDVWFGPHGKPGQVQCKQGDATAVQALVAKKLKGGYSEHGLEALGPAPSVATVEVARETMRKLHSPRHLGHQKMEQAVLLHDAERVRALLREGVSPDVRTPFDDTPCFFHPLISGHLDVVEVFLQAGVDVNMRAEGQTAFRWACYGARPSACVQALLDHGADPNATSDEGDTALMTACRAARASKTLVDVLVHGGADLSAVNQDGDTALHVAVRHGFEHPLVVQALVDHGAPQHVRNRAGFTALDIARALAQRSYGHGRWVVAILTAPDAPMEQVDPRAVRVLERIAALPHLRSYDEVMYMDDLYDAVTLRDLATAERFLEDGQDPDFPRRPGFYPMELAQKSEQREMMVLLKRYGARERGASHAAARTFAGPHVDEARTRQEQEGIAAEIRAGALGDNPDQHTVRDMPVLRYAVQGGLTEVVLALLDAGADAGVKDAGLARADEDSPQASLITAASYVGDLRTVDRLLALGADPNCAQDDRTRPLVRAMHRGPLTLVKRLLDAGADPLWVGEAHQTAINHAKGPEALAKRRLVREAIACIPDVTSKRALVTRSKKTAHADPTGLGGLTESADSMRRTAWMVARVAPDALLDALVGTVPGCVVLRDVQDRSVVAAESFAFVFRLEGRAECWMTCSWPDPGVSALAQRLSSSLETPMAHGYSNDGSFGCRDVTTDERAEDWDGVDSFLRARGFWLPSHHVRGDGHFYDHGFYAQLLLTGISEREVEAVGWVDLGAFVDEERQRRMRPSVATKGGSLGGNELDSK